ncbi:MAG: serine hydrolase domain-containing protein [Bacteroidota bacterium]
MNFKLFIPLLVIIFISLIGYTLQPQNQPADIFFEEEEVFVDYTQEIRPFLNSFSEYINTILTEKKIVGAAYAIVYKGQVITVQPYGLRKAGTEDSVDVHTLFRLASVSKGFGGVLASKLHHQKVLSLDENIISYLPDFKLKRWYNQQTLTLRNVLSQSSGVVAHSFDPWIESGHSYKSIFENFRIANITNRPGESYSYQNALFCLFDSIAHLQTGYSVQQLMRDSVFAPLGMYDASMTFEEFTIGDNYAYPHARSRWGNYYATRLNDRYYSVPTAAGVNASITDMSKWLQALMGYAPDVVSDTILSEVCQSYVKTPVPYITRKNWGNIARREYGLGWRIITTKQGMRVIQHGGYVDGYRNEIAFCPEQQIGIVFLSNAPHISTSEIVPAFMNSYKEYSDTIPHYLVKTELALQ